MCIDVDSALYHNRREPNAKKYSVIEVISFNDTKISYSNIDELRNKLSRIPGEIQSVQQCTPGATDTKDWVEIYYKYRV